MEEQTIGVGTTNGEETTNAATTTTLSADELQTRLAQLEQDGASYKDQYLRAAADLKNYKRRADQERIDLIRNAGASLLMKLLPLLDDLDLAMQHVPSDVAATPWFSGLQGVQRKLLLMLEGEGVKPIEALGKPFDPNQHEAVMNEDAGVEQAGKVTAELRRGYTLHDRVLRPAMVKVGQE
ncbi:MAG: nucleotide exchange factor GrpE [Herpetosiphonaceae bacterium]|nr:nucleotide exchange factor GrpE [Herpetosiphonaceae bacterium]